MKNRVYSGAAAAVLIILAWAGRPLAGVVMNETSIAKSPDGEIASQDKTVYVQGNKQKIARGRVIEITDLDKNVLYIIDERQRVYAEIPLGPVGPSEADTGHGELVLKKTGKVRMIANHPCSEYRKVEQNKLERVSVSACVSTSAPGAEEIAKFDQNIVARLTGGKSAENDKAGLMLEKQSVLSFHIADSARPKTYQTASLVTETRVNEIKVMSLPPETFKLPQGYRKLQNKPPAAAPSESTDSPALEVLAPDFASRAFG